MRARRRQLPGDLGLDRLEFLRRDQVSRDARLVGDANQAEAFFAAPAQQRRRARLQRHILLVLQIVNLLDENAVAVEKEARAAHVAGRCGVGKPDVAGHMHGRVSIRAGTGRAFRLS